MALFILFATIPAVLFGLFLKHSGYSSTLRSVEIIAWNAVIFGVLLYIADAVGKRVKVMEDMTFFSAIIIGLAQALALIPGTSRSGATITAARFLGFERAQAARFSFLLGIPAITGAGLLTVTEFVSAGQSIPSDALWAAFLTFFSAIAAIAFLMALVKRTSFLVFVLYRLLLALVLFALIYDWIPGFSLAV